MPVHRSLGASRLTPSTLPVGDATDMGYSQSKATLDLCVNILVRPTRISPRQSSGAARRAVKYMYSDVGIHQNSEEEERTDGGLN